MKKFLTTVGICVLSLFTFIGCGIDTKSLETSSDRLTSGILQIQEKQADLDDEALVKYIEISNEIKEFSENVDVDSIDSQEKIDELSEKFDEQYDKLKAFADDNGIKLAENK